MTKFLNFPTATAWLCGNCYAEFTDERDFRPLSEVPDLGKRLEPGGIVPAGECPDCGALVYDKKNT